MSRLAALISTTRPALTSATEAATDPRLGLADGNQTGSSRGRDGGYNLIAHIQTRNVHSDHRQGDRLCIAVRRTASLNGERILIVI